MTRINRWSTAAFLFTLAAGCSGGGDSGGGCDPEERNDPYYEPAIAQANFASGVSNPLFPLPLGTTWTYQNGPETVVVAVQSTNLVTVQGVTVVEVRDTASVSGSVIEDTLDWYAQDLDGNVWYMGEDTAEYENGEIVSTEGSWEAGVDGARAGIAMPANPIIGVPYRQEFYPCHAEDVGVVRSLDETVTVPLGTFTGCLETSDYVPLEPGIDESKFYCPGIGNVLAVDNETDEREELVTLTTSGSFAFR